MMVTTGLFLRVVVGSSELTMVVVEPKKARLATIDNTSRMEASATHEQQDRRYRTILS